MELSELKDKLIKTSEIDENCIILIDVSLSMNEYYCLGKSYLGRRKKIDTVIDAIPCLRSTKTIYALIIFSDEAVIKKQFISSFGSIISASQSIIALGRTEMQKGLESAISLFVLAPENRKKRIILLSDGSPTCSDEFVINQAKICKGLNIIIDTIAAGYDSPLMKILSELTGGKYKKAEDFNIEKVFKELKYENRYIEYDNNN